jgi:hypothetical protein
MAPVLEGKSIGTDMCTYINTLTFLNEAFQELGKPVINRQAEPAPALIHSPD